MSGAFAAALSALLAMALVLVNVPGCSSPRRAETQRRRANLILVTLDTLRADHVGCYGWERAKTPALDGFARDAIRFDDCFTPISLTTPSHLSLMTGVLPYEHGVLANSLMLSGGRGADPFVPYAGLQTIAQLARAQGYRTGGFVSAAPLKRATGIDVGFERFTEPEGERRDGGVTVGDAQAWLDSIGAAPFFLWIHLFEAHGPYRPPDHPRAELLAEFAEKSPQQEAALFARLRERGIVPANGDASDGKQADLKQVIGAIDLYDASVAQLDERVGELFADLRARGLWDASTIVVIGDHGQGLGQHDDPGHGRLWNEQLRVPFLLKPARRGGSEATAAAAHFGPGRVVLERVATIDALPTALAVTPGFDAAPFLAQCTGKAVGLDGARPDEGSRPDDGSRSLYALVARQRKLEPADAIVVGRHKYVRGRLGEKGEQLFDLSLDPFELDDLAESAEPALLESLRRRLDEWREEQEQRRARFVASGPLPASGEVDETERERLRKQLEKLGYTTDDGGADGHRDDGDE